MFVYFILVFSTLLLYFFHTIYKISEVIFKLDLQKKRIGFVLTGSFCTFQNTLKQMKKIAELEAEIVPIMSYHAYELDTKFGEAKQFIRDIETISGKEIIHSIQGAEPIGPKDMTDIMVVAPCSGNTIAKLANGITDTPALMAIKSHLREGKPVVIAIATNDGLSGSASNIGVLLNRNHYFFVPFRQDNPITKPRSLVFDIDSLIPTIEMALDCQQIQPILK